MAYLFEYFFYVAAENKIFKGCFYGMSESSFIALFLKSIQTNMIFFQLIFLNIFLKEAKWKNIYSEVKFSSELTKAFEFNFLLNKTFLSFHKHWRKTSEAYIRQAPTFTVWVWVCVWDFWHNTETTSLFGACQNSKNPSFCSSFALLFNLHHSSSPKAGVFALLKNS